MIDRKKAEKAVRDFLEAIGEDPNRAGLIGTPERVARMYTELLEGYDDNPKEHLSKVFPCEKSGLVIEKNIDFHSLCEHHLMPFFGNVSIAYLPREEVVGISKLARIVEVYARRLQIQEQMTKQIADAIQEYLNPKGVLVISEGEHTCMTMRGVKKVGSKTISISTTGVFTKDNNLVNIAMDLIKQ